MNNIELIYNNEHLSTVVEKDKNNVVLNSYFAQGKDLTKINIFFENDQKKIKKTIITFKEDIKLNYIDIPEYGYRVVAIKKNSKKIEYPTMENRVEIIDGNTVKNFSVSSDLIESWISRIKSI